MLQAPVRAALLALLGLSLACADEPPETVPVATDAGSLEDAGTEPPDAGLPDASEPQPDAGSGPSPCLGDAQCDDADPCTEDYCTAGSCSHPAIPQCAELAVFEERFDRLTDESLTDVREGGGRWTDSAACPVGLETLLDERFDERLVGVLRDPPGGWSVVEGNGSSVEVVASPAATGSARSLRLRGGTNAGSYAQATHPFTGQAAGAVELSVYAPGTSRRKWIALDEFGEGRFLLYFTEAGKISYSALGTETVLQSYAANTWYRVRIEWDVARARATVTINGTAYPDLTFFLPPSHLLDRVRVRTASAAGLDFFVDEVKATGGEHVKGGAGASLRIGWEGAACKATARHTFPLKQTGLVEFDLMALSATVAHQVVLHENRPFIAAALQASASARVALVFDADGFIKHRAGGVLHDLPTPVRYQPGQWHRVRIAWDGRAQRFSLWVDDPTTPKATGLALASPMIGGVDEVEFSLPGTQAGGSFLVDEVRVKAFDVPVTVHATDMHLGSPASDEALVAAAVREWNQSVPADVLLLTGDLSDDGTTSNLGAFASYARATNTPARCLAGNHDDGTAAPGTLTNYLGLFGPASYSFDYGRSHYVGINLAGMPSGGTELSAAELTWVDEDLAAARAGGCGGGGCEALIAFQHATPLPLADGNSRVNPDTAALALMDVLERHEVLLDLAGHSHQCELVQRQGGVYYVVSHPLASDEYPSGYRVIAQDAGGIATRLRSFDQTLPLVQITHPANRQGTCEDCGNDGCTASPPGQVDLGAGSSPSTVAGRVTVRAKVMPWTQRRLEAERDAAFAWSGSWTDYGAGNPKLSGGAARVSDTSCTTAEQAIVTFEGTGVTLLFATGADYGKAELELDGTALKGLDLYSAGYGPQRAQLVASGLEQQPHVLKVKQTGQKSASSTGCRLLLDAVDVLRDAPAVAEVKVDDGAWRPMRYRQNGVHSFIWDTRDETNGYHTLSVRAPAGTNTYTTDTIRVAVSN